MYSNTNDELMKKLQKMSQSFSWNIETEKFTFHLSMFGPENVLAMIKNKISSSRDAINETLEKLLNSNIQQ